MPLQNYFQPPLSQRRHWNAFHNAWATYLSSQLNAVLPKDYFAESNVQFGIEIDVATWQEPATEASAQPPSSWAPPAAALTIPLPVIIDLVEVQVFDSSAGPQLAAAIELVSPSNKDRPARCDAFVSRCAAYLQNGIGLIVVDVVTSRHANLHQQLLARLNSPNRVDTVGDLYGVAYHPVRHSEEPSLDIWPVTLAIGLQLPTLPLWLRGGPVFPVDFEAAYKRTCQEQRVPDNGN